MRIPTKPAHKVVAEAVDAIDWQTAPPSDKAANYIVDCLCDAGYSIVQTRDVKPPAKPRNSIDARLARLKGEDLR